VHQMRAASLTSYLEVARFVGLDPLAMLREAGISPNFLQDPENRYAADSIVGLFEESARRSGCESFGLLMAECRTFASLGPLSLLLQHLPTVRNVIQALIEYRRHMNELLNFALDERPGEAVVRLELLPEFAKPQVVELSVAMAYIVLRGASGGRWQPTAIHLIRQPPQDLAVAERMFAVPVKFGSVFNGITTTPASLATPNPLADEAMARHARRLLDLVPLEPEHDPLSDRTRRAITLLLPTGWATLENVARNLGLTPRALQRGLEKERRSFAVLLNDVKRELAQRYLIDSERPVSAIAGLTGYSSLSAFGRWFAAEFGLPAHAWRLAQSSVSASLALRSTLQSQGRRGH
jgi:AraC-like DNA-binding protein